MNQVYTPPTLTVDSVIMQLQGGKLAVLLIQRAREPFKGRWALPGGYNPAGETTLQAMDRILKKKVGLHTANLNHIEQLFTFDTIGRDPRGHTVTVTYLGLGRSISPDESIDTAEKPAFFALDNLPGLPYDHKEIISYARKRLQSKVMNTTIISTLLPAQCTLTQIQSAYEAVLGETLDKRNFRKRFLAFNFVEPTGEYSKDGPYRPAQLYTFRHPYKENTFPVFA